MAFSEFRGNPQIVAALRASLRADRVPNALFWTVSGSHLYGFSSTDSDVDLRGCFAAPLRALIGLKAPL